MSDDTVPKTDIFLAVTFWANLLLSAISLILSLFYLAIIPTEKLIPTGELWNFKPIYPLLVALVPWLYLDILTREYVCPSNQRTQPWLYLVTISGAISLIFFSIGIAGLLDHRSSVAFGIILLVFIVGCMSFAAVCRVIYDNKLLKSRCNSRP